MAPYHLARGSQPGHETDHVRHVTRMLACSIARVGACRGYARDSSGRIPVPARWLSMAANGHAWCHAARRQLLIAGFFEHQLAQVAFYMAVRAAYLLVKGAGRPADPEAAADCPYTIAEVAALHGRAVVVRDTILHFSDQGDGARLAWRRAVGQPTTFTATPDGRDRKPPQTITDAEMAAVLDALEPWFLRHRDRHLDAKAEER